MTESQGEASQNRKLTSKEREKHLTITLSKKAQEGVLDCIMHGLLTYTKAEVLERYKNNTELIEQLDEARKVATTIAKSVGEEIDGERALITGLMEFIPREQLENWAQSNNPSEISLKRSAQYFLAKELRKQRPQKP